MRAIEGEPAMSENGAEAPPGARGHDDDVAHGDQRDGDSRRAKVELGRRRRSSFTREDGLESRPAARR